MGSRAKVATLLAEYYLTGDVAEAAAELEDMAEPGLQHFLVKRACATALDKHNREREMTSLLLSSLYSEVRLHRVQCTPSEETTFYCVLQCILSLKHDLAGLLLQVIARGCATSWKERTYTFCEVH